MENKSIVIVVYAEQSKGGLGFLEPLWGRPLIDYPILEILDYVKNKNAEFFLIGDQKILDYLKEKFKINIQKISNYENPKDIVLSLDNVLLTSSQLEVTTPFDYEVVQNLIEQRILRNLKDQGVRFIDSRHTYIDSTVEIMPGSIIYPNCYLRGQTKIGKNVTIEPGAIIEDSIIENDVTIKAYSYIEKSHIKFKASIGPFARIRPMTEIGEESKIGNFVEIKKSTLESKVKVSHLSYVGDATIGEETNIGCGFITCNYDGKNKHVTKIGKRTFVGSDSQTVAPVEIGNDCFIASGTTITSNMPDESFAISRGKQITKEKMAKRFLK
jgi:bifunctional UDP-N-acetylglucosamine pyrophosphorylase / glucosamine-1-phosphate N-acetyltransferase